MRSRFTQHEIRHAIDDYARRFLVLIDDGRRKGGLALDLDRYTAATILLGAMCQLVANWLLLKRPRDLVAAGGPSVELVLGGLRRHVRASGRWLSRCFVWGGRERAEVADVMRSG